MEYSYTNLHPKNKKTSDCVIRAIAIAEGKEWLDVYDELCELGRKMFNIPNSRTVYAQYLKEKGYKKHGEIRLDFGLGCYRKATVRELEEENAIVKTNRHLLAIKDGVCRDTWDSRAEVIRGYWIKE